MSARSLARTPSLLAAAASIGGLALGQESLYQFESTNASHNYGTVVAGVGDVDGDGFDDFAVGAWGAQSRRGRVDVHSGRTGGFIVQLLGANNHDTFGFTIQAMGDVDGDGLDDFAVGIPLHDGSGVNAGAVEVRRGLTGALLHRIAAPAGVVAFGRRMGASRDINGDGVADLIIGSADSSDIRARVYSGLDGALLYTFGHAVGSNLHGSDVDGAGDVNGDGIDDFFYGVSDYQAGSGGMGFGRIRVMSGATGTKLYDVNAPFGAAAFGDSVSGLGDVNGDGFDDLLVGAPDLPTNGQADPSGSAYILSGEDGTVLRTLTAGQLTFGFGRFVSDAGDVDGDGVVDVIVANHRSILRRVFSGSSGAEIFSTTGVESTTGLWEPIAAAGDVNGDGYADVIFGTGPSIVAGAVELLGRSPEEGTPFCLGRPNSTGDRARLSATSASGFLVASNDVILSVVSLPTSSLGYFLVSQESGIVPGAGGGAGTLCLAGSVFGRYAGDVLNSGPGGEVQFSPDATSIPFATSGGTGGVAALPGDTFNFQYWYRDTQASGNATSNMSDALAVLYR